MSWVKRLICKCDVCGQEWIPVVKHPTHCSNNKCRSRLWNGSTVKPAKKHEAKGGNN